MTGIIRLSFERHRRGEALLALCDTRTQLPLACAYPVDDVVTAAVGIDRVQLTSRLWRLETAEPLTDRVQEFFGADPAKIRDVGIRRHTDVLPAHVSKA